MVDFGITAAMNVTHLRPRRESIYASLQGREQIVALLAKDVFVERAGDGQRKDGRALEVFSRSLDMDASSPSIQIDVDALVPLILHACREQLVVEGQEAVLRLRPTSHLRAREAVVLHE
jgi:hypothetical protein